MPEFVYSIGGEKAAEVAARVAANARSARGAAEARAVPDEAVGRWRMASGEAAAGEFPASVSGSSFVEYPGAGGEYSSAPVAPAISFVAEPPVGATALEITIGGDVAAQIPVSSLARSTGLAPPSSHRVGEPAAPFVVPVFAERFDQEQRFLDMVVQLRKWILKQPPFDEAAIGGKLAFDAHFWPADPHSGLFGTDDSKNQGQRLFYGDRELARRLLAPWMGTGVSLILINSTLRGGAGGQVGYSAWASVAAAPGEHWEAIGLHEVGHGLGLADEYLDSQRAGEWPQHFEPNISIDPRPSRTPWKTLATVGDMPAPTAPAGHPPLSAGTIGTFQGARYRPDLFRASETCLMRQTNQPFCAVCAAHIRSALGA
jgi:hypothetical protein